MHETPHPQSLKKGFFQRSPAFRLVVYIPILCVMLPFGIRWLEPHMTYHPMGYDVNENWQLPKNAEELWLTTTDNVKINAWLLHAPNNMPLGTVMYSHGNGGNLTHTRGAAENLAQQGFDVLIYDYRGYGRSEGSISEERELYTDGDAVYDYLTKQRHVTPDKLAIYGWSLGTTVSIDLAARRPCAALVLEAPLSSASDMASAMIPILPRALHGLLKDRFDSVRKISAVNAPVLIAHGDADEVIPTEQGRKVFAAAKEPKKLLILPGGKHWLGEIKDHIGTVANFLRENMSKKN